MLSIIIDKVEITPNPVSVGQQFLLSVYITDILSGILTSNNDYIETSDGYCLVTEGG